MRSISALSVGSALAALLGAAAARAEGPALQDEIGRLLAAGKKAEAVDAGRAAYEKSSGDAWVRHCYGWALHEAGRSDEALPHLQAAVEALPRDARARNNLGCALLATGDGKAALNAFEEALRLDAGSSEARNNRGVILEKGGNRDAAEADFREAVARDGRNARARNNLGALLYETGRPAEALEQLVEAARLEPSYASPRINLGALALDRGDSKEAERLLREAAGRPDARAEAHFNLGLLGLRTGDSELARVSFEKALALRPEDPDILNNLGVSHLLRRPAEYRKAEGYFTRACEARADFAQAWDNLGLSLHHLASEAGNDAKLLDRAEKAFRREIEIRPQGAFAHYNLGVVLVARGRVKEAEECFRRAVALAPDNAAALNNLGYCLSLSTPDRKADPEAERLCYEHALEIDPDCAEAHRSLAIFYTATPGWVDLDSATDHWKQYANLTAGDPEARKEVAEAMEALRVRRAAASSPAER